VDYIGPDFLQKLKSRDWAQYELLRRTEGSSNGRTGGFDPPNLGSNPRPSANIKEN